MYDYLKKTGWKRIPGTRKLCGVMEAKKIMLYTPVLKWYLDHGLKVTAFYQFLEYKRGKPFAWFPEKVADARRQADKDPEKVHWSPYHVCQSLKRFQFRARA